MTKQIGVGVLVLGGLVGCGPGGGSKTHAVGPRTATPMPPPPAPIDDHGDSYGSATALGDLSPPRNDHPNPLDPYHPIEHYSPIAGGGVGLLERQDDSDWFEAILAAGFSYVIHVDTDHDTHLTVIDPQADIVGESDDADPSQNDLGSALTFIPKKTGYHYFVVRRGQASLDLVYNSWNGGSVTMRGRAGAFQADEEFRYALSVKTLANRGKAARGAP